MGVLNVTPDSFSDGGRWLDPEAAIAHGKSLFAEGADVVDVGGESTRPGAAAVSVEEETARVLPVVRALAEVGRVSIDTRHGEVAVAAIDAGATYLNDISASLHKVAADKGVAWIAMHMQGEPQTMQKAPHYDDVVKEVCEYLVQRADDARRAGVNDVWIDPGIGFGKTMQHNFDLLAHLDALVETDYPVLVGVSRKSFLGTVTARPDVPPADDRLSASLAAAVVALMKGASMVRVHDVKETVRALQVVTAVRNARADAELDFTQSLSENVGGSERMSGVG